MLYWTAFLALGGLASLLYGPAVLLAGTAIHHGQLGLFEGWVAILAGRGIRALLRSKRAQLPRWIRGRTLYRRWRSCFIQINHRYGAHSARAQASLVTSRRWRSLLAPVTSAVQLLGAFWLSHALSSGIEGWRFPLGILLGLAMLAALAERRWRHLPRLREIPALQSLATALRRVRRRVGPALLIVFALLPWWTVSTTSADDALAAALHEEGLGLRGAWHWMERPSVGKWRLVRKASILLVAAPSEAPSDVLLADLRLTHEGEIVGAATLYNLTRTPLAHETDLQVTTDFAGWRVEHGQKTSAIELADFRGEGTGRGPGWTTRTRWQRAITNRQETGRWRGIGRTNLKFESPSVASFELSATQLEAKLGSGVVQLELGRDRVSGSAEHAVSLTLQEPPLPGDLTTWTVDRLRAISWIGSDTMQWVKAMTYRTLNQLEELEAEVIGINAQEAVSDQLGDVLESLPLAGPTEVPGWPLEPVEPILSPPLPGEGRWVSFDSDPIVSANAPGLGPSPFLFSFIRVDRKRPHNQVSFVLWDPRRLELHIVAGSTEPKSTTGELGSGLIPRDPVILRRLAAAFNGAFQAVHGEFGMMEQRRIVLPPKPYAATVVTFEDGTAGFGSWPLADPIPRNAVGLRQNLTALLVDDRINPYGRTYWGGVPENWTEETRTVRSGTCLTAEGFMAYFYTPSADPEMLARAMRQTRCNYGIHLDMNAGHTGFEFYHVTDVGGLPALDKPLDPHWEARGSVVGAPGLEFASRLMVRKMPFMNFPRYIRPSARDFFYLTRRVLLPEAALTPLLPNFPEDGAWRASSSSGSWPRETAVTRLHAPRSDGSPQAFLVWRFDSKLLSPIDPKAAAPAVVVEVPEPALDEDAWLHWTTLGPSISTGRQPLAANLAGRATPGNTAAAALCVADGGLLTVAYSEDGSVADSTALGQILDHVRCGVRLYSSTPPTIRLGGTDSPSATPKTVTRQLRMFKRPFVGARRIFEQTPILPQADWGLIQARRPVYSPPP